MRSGSEASEVGHAARLVTLDASLPLRMTRQGAFFTSWHGGERLSSQQLLTQR